MNTIRKLRSIAILSILFSVILFVNAHSQSEMNGEFNNFAAAELSDLSIDLNQLKAGAVPDETKNVIHVRRENYIQRQLDEYNFATAQDRRAAKNYLEGHIPIIEDPRFHRRLETYYSLQPKSHVSKNNTYKDPLAFLDETREQIRNQKKRNKNIKLASLVLMSLWGFWFVLGAFRAPAPAGQSSSHYGRILIQSFFFALIATALGGLLYFIVN